MHSIVLADVLADVGRAADVDLAGRQEDVDADVDQQAALDLAGDAAGDDVAFVDGLHDLHPLFDLLGLALAEDDHAAIVEPAVAIFDVFDEDADHLADFRLIGLFRSSHSLRGIDAFALVADVDEDEFVVDADDFAFDDLIDVDVLPTEPTGVVGSHLAYGVDPIFLRNVELANKIAVNHR